MFELHMCFTGFWKSTSCAASQSSWHCCFKYALWSIPSGRGQLESNALEHMNTRMRLRGRQQDSLSGKRFRNVKRQQTLPDSIVNPLLLRLQGSLRIPAGNLQMNQANRFRETQEKRDMLNKVVHSGRVWHRVMCIVSLESSVLF